jgi:hypothetical protein
MCWELAGNYLTRRHYAPRQSDFVPDEKICPIPLHFLDKKKVVSMGSYLYREKWKSGNPKPKYATNTWTGYTRFKILPAWRKQAKELFNKNLEECCARA